MHGSAFLIDIGIAILAALVGGFAARVLRIPVLVGYLAAGVFVGPHTPGLTARTETVSAVANFGVALLMFAVGVHFSLERLRSARRAVLVGGTLQIAATIALGVVVGRWLHWGVFGGIFLGCCLALSSTAVMTKILEERDEQDTTYGRVMLGMLIAQDLSMVVIVPILPSLAGGEGLAPGALLRALVLGGTVLIAVVLLALRGVPALMKAIERLGSQELFLLAGVGICVGSAIAAEAAGLGMALGAFLGGLVISETDYAHQLFAQIRPLRDLFAALFFVSIGMLLDPALARSHALEIIALLVAIVVGKGVISAAAIVLVERRRQTAVIGGFGLAQIGEFTFVLVALGESRHWISSAIAGTILSSAVLSLVLAPFVYQMGRTLAFRSLSKS